MADLGSSSTVGRVEPFTGTNYYIWQLKVSAILRSRKLFKSVIEAEEPAEGGAPGSAEAKLRDTWETQNDEAFGIIILTLSPEQAALFIGETNARKVWDELKRVHAGNLEDRRIDTELELKNIQMGSKESVEGYVTRARSIATKCAVLGRAIPERELVYHVVRGVNPNFENIASVLRPNRSLTLEDVQQALKEEESRMHGRVSQEREGAYRATGRNYVKQQRYDTRKCYVCGKPGHLARECWCKNETNKQTGPKVRFKDSDRNQSFAPFHKPTTKGKKEHVHVASGDEKPVTKHQVFHATVTDCIKDSESMETWGIDSGCSAHMTPNIDNMVDVKPIQMEVNLAEKGRSIKAEARGNVQVETVTKDGNVHKVLIKDVLYVPQLRSNLLSVKGLAMNGNTVVFADNDAKIYNSEHELIAEARIENNMYVVTTERQEYDGEIRHCMLSEIPEKHAVDTESQTCTNKELWHKRLGHVNDAYIEKLKRENMVRGLTLKPGPLGLCESCTLGKMAQLPFGTYDDDGTTSPLELVHMDLCGPFQQSSLGNARYVFTLVDAYSRRIFVYFLRAKDETFTRFIEFKTCRENEIGTKIKAIRSDNGSEFVNNQFDMYLKNQGIKHQKTVAYTPQNNSVAERANRTLIDGARTLLIDSGLPLPYWAEAVATVAHVKNCLPTQGKGSKTPMELWTGRKPTVAYFKVFGCQAYYYVPKAKRRHKLEPKAKKGIFLGYSQTRKAYRIYNPEDGSICESRSVKWDENRKGADLLEPKLKENDKLTYPLPIGREREEHEHLYDDDNNQNEQNRDQENHDVELEYEEPILRSRGRKRGDTEAVIKLRHQMNLQNREERLQAEGARRSERLKAKGNNATSMQTNTGERPNSIETPGSYEEAVSSPNSTKWHNAMEEEIEALQQHQVWKLVRKAKGMKVIKSKWVYKVKTNPDGTVNRHKARLVACGYNQRQGIDYEDSFAPVMRQESVRLLVTLAAHLNLKLRKLDVKSAYLHGDLQEQVYMEQPNGFIQKGKEDHVCLLQKGLYGLPQAGKCWNDTLHNILTKLGFNRLQSEPSLYIWKKDKEIVVLGAYVDDLLLTGSCDELVNKVIDKLKSYVDLRNSEENNTFLGIDITETDAGFQLSQISYIDKILAKYGLTECNPVKTPGDPRQDLNCHQDSAAVDKELYLEMLGSLMYLSVCTRPDIAFNVCQLSQYSREPKQMHLTALKRVYRYLKGSRDLKLTFDKRKGELEASTDASWCSTSDAKSFSGYTVKMGDSLISWKSCKQRLVALSTCEAEIIALCEGVREVKWMTSVLSELELFGYLKLPITVKTDSQAAYNWITNCNQTARTKHINRKFYYIRDEVKKGNIELQFVRSEKMEADFLTKNLSKDKLDICIQMIGLKNSS